LDLDPELPDARMALGWYYYVGERDYEAALRELSIAASSMPADSEIHWRLGAVYRRQGSWNDALAEFERAIDLQPEDVWWRIVLAETYTHLREYEQAERQLEIILDLVPNDIQSLFWEIQIPLFRDGDVTGLVAAAANPALDVEMSWAVPRPLLGYTAALYRRDYDNAIAYLDTWASDEWSEARYVARDAAYAMAHELAGQETQARRHFELALRQIEQRLAEDDDNPALFMALGESLAGLGRYEEANQAARESIAIYREQRDAMDLPVQRLDAALRVLIRTGEVEAALDELDAYFSVPAVWSLEGVLPDPRLDPIRDHPRFVALREQYERP
jgi:tetratricopeptide (TPR) repeat protein